MGKTIRQVFKIDTLSLHECTDGYFLYDYVVGMNISMRAKTEQDAYIEALLWYQGKNKKLKEELKDITSKVDDFIGKFVLEEDN